MILSRSTLSFRKSRLLFAKSSFQRTAAPCCCTSSSSSSLFPQEEDSSSHLQHQHRHQHQTIRNYHSTKRHEILPLIGVAAVFVIGRYSYKALQRMDAEWEDYQWELQQYEKKLARTSEQQHPVRTIAIDLGSIYTKIAASGHPKPEVIVSPEGDRYFFNGIQYEQVQASDTENGLTHMVRGRKALERFYYSNNSYDNVNGNGKAENHTTITDVVDDEPCPVQLPWNVFATTTTNDNDTNEGHEIVSDILDPALMEVLDRLDYKYDDPEATPFRSVATVPTQYLQSTAYRQAFETIAATLLPEPVTAIWGAQTYSLLPLGAAEDSKMGQTTLVVDVGGLNTQISLVQKDRVLSSITLPWGGERWIQLTVDMLLPEAGSPLHDGRSLAALYQHARSAVAELSLKTRVNIHVPYLFPDPGNHHLNTTLSRNVWEQALQDDIRERLASIATESGALSPHMPTPTDLASLWISAATQVLELAQMVPSNVDHVLLVGGASRAPIVASSLDTALYTLMGADVQKKLIVPESSLSAELTVVGASTLLPTYEYSADEGLHRIETSP